MGLFTGRQVFTTTAAYNLAGEHKNRFSFRKSAIVSIILGNRGSIGELLPGIYFNGPGIRLKKFHRWAETNYTDIGTPAQIKLTIDSALAGDIRPLVLAQLTPGEDVAIQGTEVGEASYQYFAEQYMLENHRALFNTNWRADINDATNEVTIWDASDVVLATFTPANFDKGSIYLYATYLTSVGLGVYIYEFGSGDPVLDLLIGEQLEGTKSYFPIIPIRLDGEFVSEMTDTRFYDLAKPAFKKATGGSILDIEKSMEEDSDSLDLIDYAYVTFGASATSPEQSHLEYAFEWLDEIGSDTGYDSVDYDAWKTSTPGDITAVEYFRENEEYLDGESGIPPDPPPGYDPNNENGGSGPDGPPSRPFRGVYISAPGSLDINYDVRITWGSIKKETAISGLGKPDAEVGEYWFAFQSESFDYKMLAVDSSFDSSTARQDKTVYLYHQSSAFEHERLIINGMVQRTYVFGSHYEELDLADVIANQVTGVESSFIFPLRYSTLSNMPLIAATEFAMSCQYVTTHSFEIVTQGFLASLTIILAVVITVVTLGSGIGASAGILGSNLSVGIALGASAATAAIIGFAVNTLAAIVLTQIINVAATEIFGARLGALLGAIFSFIAINGLTNMAAGNGFSIGFAGMSTAQNVMYLTSSVGNAYQRYLVAGIQETLEATQELIDDFRDESKKIEELYAQNIGYGNGVIDPFQQFVIESPEVFLERTLMTGSDIAELTESMVSNFAELSITTSLPLD